MDPLSLSWNDIYPFIAIGFFAQLIDGSLGLAFGVLSNTLLSLIGFPPSVASATTRSVESFTTGASGLAHIVQRNVDWHLFARIVVPGIIGSLIGIWILNMVGNSIFRPVLYVYLMAVGVYLLWRAPRQAHKFRNIRLTGTLGFFGGFFDSSGGGGWGPLVTGNLLAQGMTPRMAIGTVNAAEFFITVTVLAMFIGMVGPEQFTIAATGLIAGGIVAAPLGALFARRMAPATLLRMVGAMLIAMSVWGIAALAISPLPIFSRF